MIRPLLSRAPIEEKSGHRQGDPDADHGEYDQEQRVIGLKIKCNDDYNEKRANEQGGRVKHLDVVTYDLGHYHTECNHERAGELHKRVLAVSGQQEQFKGKLRRKKQPDTGVKRYVTR